ncbi:unnamed protein product [Rotaria sordida]|uniref:Uncharacterized protein n=1 Tax=Rotaria sordida TaxID=392033 RepID=A0A819LEQ1_9BILA|nr:unnamed protein product [Rotaria sordida]
MATNSNQYYIYVVQDGVIRLTNSSPNQIVGATTNGVQTCVVHVFIGVNDNVSFFHTATTVSLASIQKELEWAKPLRKWYIIANDNKKYDENRPELQKLQEVKAYVSEHDPISPEEKRLANREAFAVTYRRYNQQEPLIIGDSPDNNPIIMPPFADKLLAISFLNGLVSGLDTVDLLVQSTITAWLVIDDNGKPAQRCQQIIKDALEKRNLIYEFDEIENPRNAMSISVTTIRIPDMQKEETAEKLHRS